MPFDNPETCVCRWKQQATAEHIKFHPASKKVSSVCAAPSKQNMSRGCLVFWSITAAVSGVFLPLPHYNDFLPVWLLSTDVKWQLWWVLASGCSLIITGWNQNLTFTGGFYQIAEFSLAIKSYSMEVSQRGTCISTLICGNETNTYRLSLVWTPKLI